MYRAELGIASPVVPRPEGFVPPNPTQEVIR